MENTPNRYLDNLAREYALSNQQSQLDDLESAIKPLARSVLPSGADGICYPTTRTGGYANDMSSHRQDFVRNHEIAHNVYDLIDELKTDCLAAARSGHYEFIRTPISNNYISFN